MGFVGSSTHNTETNDHMKVNDYFHRPQTEADLQPGRDHCWDELMESNWRHDCVDVDANDPLYILYTSGTTGE